MPNEDSNQAAHLRSPISLLCPHEETASLAFENAPSEDSNQTVNVPADLNLLFVLRFYGPVNQMGSCRARSVYLTTRLLGRLSPLSG